MYKIIVTKSGGALPAATTYLKSNGKVFETESEQVAKQKATEYNERMNEGFTNGVYYHAKSIQK